MKKWKLISEVLATLITLSLIQITQAQQTEITWKCRLSGLLGSKGENSPKLVAEYQNKPFNLELRSKGNDLVLKYPEGQSERFYGKGGGTKTGTFVFVRQSGSALGGEITFNISDDYLLKESIIGTGDRKITTVDVFKCKRR